MNKYETIVILKEGLSDEQVNNNINKFKEIITYDDKLYEPGVVENVDIEKRKLAYEVKGYKEGIFATIQFTGDGHRVNELERVYRITDDVLKFIVIRKCD